MPAVVGIDPSPCPLGFGFYTHTPQHTPLCGICWTIFPSANGVHWLSGLGPKL